MTVFYLDTSALVKRYRTEEGTEAVSALLENSLPEDRFYTSFLSVLEFTAGITRLMKGDQLSETTGEEFLARYRSDVEEIFRIWPLDEEVTSSAISIAQEYGLRSGDAIHLSSALQLYSSAPGEWMVLVSSDAEPLDAATSAGLEILNPQEPIALSKLASLRISSR